MLLGGALFGACFPAIATTVDCLLTFGQISLAHLVRTQIEQPLRWMIDTVPIFLSLFAGFTGHHFDQLRKLTVSCDVLFGKIKGVKRSK
jgi:hypothetical protein